MLTPALLNMSCCARRDAVSATRTEAVESDKSEAREESTAHTRTEGTLTGKSQEQTRTEIEIYDTDKPADPKTGEHPVKARVKQWRDERGSVTATGQTSTDSASASRNEQEHKSTRQEEAKETETKSPGLWERIKSALGVVGAAVTLAAGGWIILRVAKR